MSGFEDEQDHLVDRRMALVREWDKLVSKVRKLQGFEDFLGPPALKTLLPAASGGPVIVVNVSRWRCDALIVSDDGVAQRALPHLTLDQTTKRATAYLETLREAEVAAHAHHKAQEAVDEDPGPTAIREQLRAAQSLLEAESRTDDMLRSLQEWLWDTVAAPVLNALELDRMPGPNDPWPRLWWCPTGPLTLLPLHAAGYHGPVDATPGAPVPRTVIDRVVSSYTPTLRALLEARKAIPSPTDSGGGADGDRAGEETNRDRLLIVAVEDALGQPVLHNVTRERELLTRLFPPSRRTLLEGPRATRAQVSKKLSQHRWVHFSCHGDQDLNEPSRGGLLLTDGMLSVADIAARQFRGDFAGLSACKTAVGGIHLLDEVITLAAALHYTGYRHVVAALWSVDDETSANVFRAVYGDITADGRLRPDGAATALHHALRALRDETPDEPRLWAPFTHTGP
ncbi:CHAT domain-containing protein [Streptomyces sp. NPDC058086]|uniref:CHAT domain-containing protein n=1 Tax=Streptomyces sp. NPDC058086 TaxID=3346334 RepID=UPI0036E0FA64